MSDDRFLRSLNWRAIPLDRETARSLSDEFQVLFLQSVLEIDPENMEVMIQLGDLYTRLGRLEESLAIDIRLVKLCPEEKVFHYNLACTYSVLKHMDSALLALEKALLLGYDDIEQIETDTDLGNLRKDRRFRHLIKAHFNRELQA
jgi:tetratricopeptide (TPR) repeat protein